MIQFDEDKQNRQLKDLHKREEEELMQIMSAKYGVEYIDLSATPLRVDGHVLRPASLCARHGLYPGANRGVGLRAGGIRGSLRFRHLGVRFTPAVA